MAREITYTAIILKKQAFEETNEIITLYTREAGKLRVYLLGAKKPTSKLASFLQPLFISRVNVARNFGPGRIIAAEVLHASPAVRSSLESVKSAIVATETLLKATADEQPNERLFENMANLLYFLDRHGDKAYLRKLALLKYRQALLRDIGMGVIFPKDHLAGQSLYFSNTQGGFVYNPTDMTATLVQPGILDQFLLINDIGFSDIAQLPEFEQASLDGLLTKFLHHHLEREIKSDRFIDKS